MALMVMLYVPKGTRLTVVIPSVLLSASPEAPSTRADGTPYGSGLIVYPAPGIRDPETVCASILRGDSAVSGDDWEPAVLVPRAFVASNLHWYWVPLVSPVTV